MNMHLDSTRDFCGKEWEQWAKAEKVFRYIAEAEKKVLKLSDAFIYRHCAGCFSFSGGRAYRNEIVISGEDVAAILDALVEDEILESEDDCYCTLYKLTPEVEEIYDELVYRARGGKIEGSCLSKIQRWGGENLCMCKTIDVARVIDKDALPLMNELQPEEYFKVSGEHKGFYYACILQVFADRLKLKDELGEDMYETLDSLRLTIDDIYEGIMGVGCDDFGALCDKYVCGRETIFEALIDLWKAGIVMEWDNAYILRPTRFMQETVTKYRHIEQTALEGLSEEEQRTWTDLPSLYDAIEIAFREAIEEQPSLSSCLENADDCAGR